MLILGYFLSPKFIDYSLRKELITDNLNEKSKLSLEQYSDINYEIFPSPRIAIKKATFNFNKGLVVTNESDLYIILNIKELFKFKSLNFKSILVKKGNAIINIDKIKILTKTLKKNKKNILFEDSNFILSENNKDLFKIKFAKLKIENKNLESTIKLNGTILDEKIFINFISTNNNKNNLSLRIPSIDSSIKIFFENEKNNEDVIIGLANIEILNNFLQFNFKKNEKYEIENGYIRNDLINTSIKGFLTFKPNLYFYLNLQPNMFNTKKIFLYSLEKYLLPDIKKLNFIKKLNGEINLDFQNLFKGKIIFENGSIFLKNMIIKKNDDLMTIDTNIEDLNKTKKVAFDLSKQINDKKNLDKLINIRGLLIPSKNKIVFKEISINKKPLSKERVKFYEKNFEKEMLNESFDKFFNYKRINKYFKNF